jgi:hypothetical protein
MSYYTHYYKLLPVLKVLQQMWCTHSTSRLMHRQLAIQTHHTIGTLGSGNRYSRVRYLRMLLHVGGLVALWPTHNTTSPVIVHDRYWGFLVTHKTLTRRHAAFGTSGLFWKIAVRLDSPYLRQIASIRKMPKNAIACHTSIRRFQSELVVCTLYEISYRIEFFLGGKVPGPFRSITGSTACVYTRTRLCVHAQYRYLI